MVKEQLVPTTEVQPVQLTKRLPGIGVASSLTGVPWLSVAVQSGPPAPQSTGSGSGSTLTTLPFDRGVTVRTYGIRLKVAVTDWFAIVTERLVPDAVNVHAPLGWPSQMSPVQPPNRVPVGAAGASVTRVPVKISSKQLVPHAMPGPLTVPAPVPAFSTLTPVTPRKSAVLLVLAITTKSQVAFARPAQGPPDQVRKRLPDADVAVKTTRVP